MVDGPLISDELLAPHLDEARQRARALDPPLSYDLDDPVGGGALARHLLLERWPELLGGQVPSTAVLFYSSYYWFKRFIAARALAYGPDAGLEQQGFGLLEQAPPEVDWALVQTIDSQAVADARAEAAKPRP